MEQLEEVAKQSRSYAKGQDRNDRWSQIEQGVRTVLNGKSLSKQGGYMVPKVEQAKNVSEKLIRIAVKDYDQKHPLVKVIYRFGHWTNIVNPYRTVEKQEQEIIRAADTLEGLAQEAYNERDHPRTGLVVGLEELESYRDEAYELKDLCIDERTDLDLEIQDQKKMYNNKEFGPGQKYESRADLRKQIRVGSKAHRTVDLVIGQTNLKILEAQAQIEGSIRTIGITDAFTTMLEAKAFELRRKAIKYKQDPKMAERIGNMGYVLNEGLQKVMESYDGNIAELNGVMGDLTESIGDMEHYMVPIGGDDKGEMYDPGDLIKTGKRTASTIDSEVEKLRTEIEDAAFVY